LIQLLFSSLGLISGIASNVLGKQVAARVGLLIEKMIEDHHDECLRILNENEIDEKELRKVLCQVRDKGYVLSDQIKQQYNIEETKVEEAVFFIPKQVLKILIDLSKKL